MSDQGLATATPADVTGRPVGQGRGQMMSPGMRGQQRGGMGRGMSRGMRGMSCPYRQRAQSTAPAAQPLNLPPLRRSSARILSAAP